MLCPAILDPFEGQNYRIGAFIHQMLLCPILCKLMCLFAPENQQQIMALVGRLFTSGKPSSSSDGHNSTSTISSTSSSSSTHATNGTNRQQQPPHNNIDIISDNNQLLITNCENSKIDKID
jgi:TMEM164 family